MNDGNVLVGVIMGSTSDLGVMGKAAQLLEDFGIPFEMNALSLFFSETKKSEIIVFKASPYRTS